MPAVKLLRMTNQKEMVTAAFYNLMLPFMVIRMHRLFQGTGDEVGRDRRMWTGLELPAGLLRFLCIVKSFHTCVCVPHPAIPASFI